MRFTLDVTVVSACEPPQGVKSGEIITEKTFKWGHIGCNRRARFFSLDMKQSCLRYALHREWFSKSVEELLRSSTLTYMIYWLPNYLSLYLQKNPKQLSETNWENCGVFWITRLRPALALGLRGGLLTHFNEKNSENSEKRKYDGDKNQLHGLRFSHAEFAILRQLLGTPR